MSDKKFVTYAEFGAVGDGKTNDFAAIKAAHDYANAEGKPVKIEGEPTYYISDTTIGEKPVTVSVKTSVDWGRAKFIIDDTDLDYSNRLSKYSIFTVESDYADETVTDPEILSRLAGIGEGTKKLDLALGYPALVIPYDENIQVYRRYGASFAARGGQSSPQHEILLVDKDGNIDESTPFMFNYSVVTKLLIIRCDVKPITISGGEFTTKASRVSIFFTDENGERNCRYGYFQRGLLVKRSYTTVDGVKHFIEGEFDLHEEKSGLASPCYTGFFRASYANEVTIKNCVITGRRCYQRPKGGTGGTYGFSADHINKIRLIGCKQSNFYVDRTTGRAPTSETKPEDIVLSMADSPITGTKMCWGIGGTNFCKNMEYYGCTLSRFDAHQGLLNGKIIDSTITFMALTGKGNLLLENTHWLSPGPGPVNNCMLYLRNDYGATWDGTITLKNCRATVSEGELYLIQHSYMNWSFGYVTHFPNLVVDNLRFENLEDGAALSLTSEWKSMTKEPSLHLPRVDNTPYKTEDGEDCYDNLNPVASPTSIKIINNEGGYKYQLSKGLEFFKNTKFEGVTLI